MKISPRLTPASGSTLAGDPPQPGAGRAASLLSLAGAGAVGLRTHRCLPPAPRLGQSELPLSALCT